MTRSPLLRHLCALLAGGLVQACAGATPPAVTSLRDAALPLEVCLTLEHGDLQAVRQGRLRVQLSLRHVHGSVLYGPGLALYLLDRGSGKRQLLELFALHPDAVDDADPPTPQNFLFALRDRTLVAGPLCLQLDRQPAQTASAAPTSQEAAVRYDIDARWQRTGG